MSFRVKTNAGALRMQRQLSIQSNRVGSAVRSLSSSNRITRAADDAARLAVSSNLRADIRSLNVAKRNASDGVSMMQTTEMGLEQAGTMIIRLRELAVQSASDTVSSNERGYLNREYKELKNEIDRLSAAIDFNGTKVLAGDRSNMPAGVPPNNAEYPIEIQVGKDYYDNVDSKDSSATVNLIRAHLNEIAGFSKNLGIGTVGASSSTTIDTKQAAKDSLSALDKAITKVSSMRAHIGAVQNHLGATVRHLSEHSINLSSARRQMQDTDYAKHSSLLAHAKILQKAGTSLLSAANADAGTALSLLNDGI